MKNDRIPMPHNNNYAIYLLVFNLYRYISHINIFNINIYFYFQGKI